MSKICKITGKKTIVGNHRSHAMNANKRKFYPNLHNHRLWLQNKKKFIRIKISTKGLRLIDKYGIERFLKIFKIKK